MRDVKKKNKDHLWNINVTIIFNKAKDSPTRLSIPYISLAFYKYCNDTIQERNAAIMVGNVKCGVEWKVGFKVGENKIQSVP